MTKRVEAIWPMHDIACELEITSTGVRIVTRVERLGGPALAVSGLYQLFAIRDAIVEAFAPDTGALTLEDYES